MVNTFLEQVLNVAWFLFLFAIYFLLCHLVARRAIRTGKRYKPFFLLSLLFLPYVAIWVYLFRSIKPQNIGVIVQEREGKD